MDISKLAKQIKDSKENIILIYAFNATGKTRLSVGYKDYTKSINEGNHAGVYYNAFSEDLFTWNNDEENDNRNIALEIIWSSLNQFHSFIADNPTLLEEKLALYNPNYKFIFNPYEDKDPEKGIFSITFYKDEETKEPIKISRGEERIFVWCFFLALFELDEWSGKQDAHFYIDDPVSSLDEHNIFITAESIVELIEKYYLKKNIIISTHHIGLFSFLYDRLKRGEKAGRFKSLTKCYLLKRNEELLSLVNFEKDVFLFHLHLIQTIDIAIKTKLFIYHYVLLRQLLENISSFLGVSRFSYVLEQIGITNLEETSAKINALSHKNIYKIQFNEMNEDEEKTFKDIFRKIVEKYNFIF